MYIYTLYIFFTASIDGCHRAAGELFKDQNMKSQITGTQTKRKRKWSKNEYIEDYLYSVF